MHDLGGFRGGVPVLAVRKVIGCTPKFQSNCSGSAGRDGKAVCPPGLGSTMPNISHAGQPKNKTAVLELFLKPKLH